MDLKINELGHHSQTRSQYSNNQADLLARRLLAGLLGQTKSFPHIVSPEDIHSLPPKELHHLEKCLGPKLIHSLKNWSNLSEEGKWNTLLELGDDYQSRGHNDLLNVMIYILARFNHETLPAKLQKQIEYKVNAWQGIGLSRNDQIQHDLKKFFEEALDPRALLPMTVGIGLARWTAYKNLKALNRFNLVHGTRFWSVGIPGRILTASPAFAVETLTMSLGTRVLMQWSGENMSRPLKEDIAATVLTLGFFRGASLLNHHLLKSYFSGTDIFTKSLFSQSTSFIALLSSHSLETSLGLRPKNNHSILYNTSLSFMHLGLAGKMSHLALGSRFRKLESLVQAEHARFEWQANFPKFGNQLVLAGEFRRIFLEESPPTHVYAMSHGDGIESSRLSKSQLLADYVQAYQKKGLEAWEEALLLSQAYPLLPKDLHEEDSALMRTFLFEADLNELRKLTSNAFIEHFLKHYPKLSPEMQRASQEILTRYAQDLGHEFTLVGLNQNSFFEKLASIQKHETILNPKTKRYTYKSYPQMAPELRDELIGTLASNIQGSLAGLDFTDLKKRFKEVYALVLSLHYTVPLREQKSQLTGQIQSLRSLERKLRFLIPMSESGLRIKGFSTEDLRTLYEQVSLRRFEAERTYVLTMIYLTDPNQSKHPELYPAAHRKIALHIAHIDDFLHRDKARSLAKFPEAQENQGQLGSEDDPTQPKDLVAEVVRFRQDLYEQADRNEIDPKALEIVERGLERFMPEMHLYRFSNIDELIAQIDFLPHEIKGEFKEALEERNPRGYLKARSIIEAKLSSGIYQGAEAEALQLVYQKFYIVSSNQYEILKGLLELRKKPQGHLIREYLLAEAVDPQSSDISSFLNMLYSYRHALVSSQDIFRTLGKVAQFRNTYPNVKGNVFRLLQTGVEFKEGTKTLIAPKGEDANLQDRLALPILEEIQAVATNSKELRLMPESSLGRAVLLIVRNDGRRQLRIVSSLQRILRYEGQFEEEITHMQERRARIVKQDWDELIFSLKVIRFKGLSEESIAHSAHLALQSPQMAELKQIDLLLPQLNGKYLRKSIGRNSGEFSDELTRLRRIKHEKPNQRDVRRKLVQLLLIQAKKKIAKEAEKSPVSKDFKLDEYAEVMSELNELLKISSAQKDRNYYLQVYRELFLAVFGREIEIIHPDVKSINDTVSEDNAKTIQALGRFISQINGRAVDVKDLFTAFSENPPYQLKSMKVSYHRIYGLNFELDIQSDTENYHTGIALACDQNVFWVDHDLAQVSENLSRALFLKSVIDFADVLSMKNLELEADRFDKILFAQLGFDFSRPDQARLHNSFLAVYLEGKGIPGLDHFDFRSLSLSQLLNFTGPSSGNLGITYLNSGQLGAARLKFELSGPHSMEKRFQLNRTIQRAQAKAGQIDN